MDSSVDKLEIYFRSKSDIDLNMCTRVLIPVILSLESKKCDEKFRIKSYAFITFLLEKMHISNLYLNRNLFLKLFDLCKIQLITNINPVKVIKPLEKEELKLAVLKCVTKLFQSLSDDDFEFIYESCFQKLSPQIFICLEILKFEKFRTLKIQSIICLQAIFGDFNSRKCDKISIIQKLHCIAPGVLSNLIKVLNSDQNSGSAFFKETIRFFGRFFSVQINDNIHDPLCLKWISESLEKIELQVLLKFAVFDRNAVKLQLIETCGLLLETCAKNLGIKIKIPIEILLTLSEDDDPEICKNADMAIVLLKKLSDNVTNDNTTILDIIEENFCDVITRFTNDFFTNIDDTKQWSSIVLLLGYCKILGPYLADIFHSSYQFNQLMTTLLMVVEFRENNFIIDELSLISTEFQYDWTYEKFNEKRLKYFEDKRNLSKFLEIGHYLSKNRNLFVQCYDYLWDAFTKCPTQRRQCIFLMTCLFLGLKSDTADIDGVKKYLNSIVEEDVWYLSYDSNECDNSVKLMQNNLEIICLMLESIGILAKVFQQKFRCFLRKLIYIVFERAGSNLARVSHSGLFAINQMALGCGYASVRDMIDDQSNYLQSEIKRRLRHVDRKSMVLNAISVIAKFQVIKMTQYFFHIVKEILMESCDEFHYDNRLSFLKVFNILLDSLNKDFLNNLSTKRINIKDSRSLQDNQESEKPPVPVYVEIISQIIKRSLNFLPTKSDRNCKIVALSNVKKGLKLIEDFEDQLLPLIHQTWSALIDRFRDYNDYLVINFSLQLLSVMAETSKSFIRLRASKDVWPQICHLMEKLSREPSHTPFEQQYKLQLELLDRTAVIVQHLDMTDNDLILLIGALKNYLHENQPITFQNPFWIVQLPNDDCAKKVANRSVLLRHCIELWSFSLTGNWTELMSNLKVFTSTNYFQTNLAHNSFKICIESYGKHIHWDEKMKKINRFECLPLKGPVDLHNHQMLINYIEFYGLDSNNTPEEPVQSFIGHKICDSGRYLINDFSLKTRKFIGNTSMEPQLSFLMANQGQVQRNHIVLDPFVGTGSLLVSSAFFGAYVIGSDIDYMTIHARSRPSRINQKEREKDESILANLTQYSLQNQYIDVIINDFSTPAWKTAFLFDAIITDPPYGIRESSKKTGKKKSKPVIKPVIYDAPHFPERIRYDFDKLFSDLLDFAASHLKIGGRLVFWFPVTKNNDLTEDLIPEHPSLSLIGNSLQVLNTYVMRHLLTYKKIK